MVYLGLQLRSGNGLIYKKKKFGFFFLNLKFYTRVWSTLISLELTTV
jgi:hypothetical protein